LNPTTPQNAAGIRDDPEVSVPSDTGHSPEATPAALPEDEPPVMYFPVVARGLMGLPNKSFVPTPENANSDRFVFPPKTIP
ncbi:hypothetical protein R0K18_26390, partial [Pantoea sp. SIMBA_133]